MEQANPASGQPATRQHTISIVIPVYGGERTLAGVIAEIAPLTTAFTTPAGHVAVVTEVLTVWDNGPDDSPRVMRDLAEKYEFVRPVWLSRNFGQHPATFAGMASSGGDWIVTLDEDGQHDPRQISRLLDTAIAERASIVYAKPINAAPHGFVRNLASKSAKRFIRSAAGGGATDFQSYRLVLGEIGRSVAAYAGSGVYLDVALGWVADRVATCPIELRDEGAGRRSGYSYRRLLSHFWRMVLSSGTKGLRLVSLLGALALVLGVLLAVVLLIQVLVGSDQIPQGWASTMIVLLLATGAVLFSLGIVAEYIGVAVNMAMGRPPYLIVSDPADGPLGAARPAPWSDAVAAAALPGATAAAVPPAMAPAAPTPATTDSPR